MKLGFIGSGKMASALVQGVLKSGLCAAADVAVTDRHPPTAKALAQATGAVALEDAAAIAKYADTIVLCVKPGDAGEVFRQLNGLADGKLLISILAGVTLGSLQEMAGAAVRLARVMPNTPALVHKGAAAYALSANATEEDAATVEQLLGSVGVIFRLKEELLDAVTGLSGSGPAYIYVVIEAMSDAGVLMGLPRETALQLAAQTVAGAAEMVLQTGTHPALLKDMVASPGGTTIAGLESLEKDGLRAALLGAVRAATEKSRFLGGKK